jgi:hypothetical protein
MRAPGAPISPTRTPTLGDSPAAYRSRRQPSSLRIASYACQWGL